jgi:putative aldouronate transport system permease protein
MQNTLNMQASDIISTHVYRKGIIDGQYSYSAAVGLFNSVVNFILLVAVNRIARKVNDTSLW